VSGPLSIVLAELAAGTPTLTEMARRSGLEESVVRAAVNHLIRSGRVEARELSMGCPASGCGNCASGTDTGAPGCGLGAPVPGRRAGLITLTLTRR
jgi:hypothetical protein